MKHILVSACLGIYMMSCATTGASDPVDLYPQLGVESVQENCQPSETWRVSALGLPGFVVLFETCLGTKKLLMISVDASAYTPEIRGKSVELLGLHYIEFLNRRNAENSELKSTWTLKKIKEVNSHGGDIHFHLLLEEKPVCKGEDGRCTVSVQ